MNWIKFSDAQPENGMDVLVYGHDMLLCLAYCSSLGLHPNCHLCDNPKCKHTCKECEDPFTSEICILKTKPDWLWAPVVVRIFSNKLRKSKIIKVKKSHIKGK
jgi:hypothetical protein